MLAIQINKPIWLSKQNTETAGFYILNYLYIFIWFFYFGRKKETRSCKCSIKKNGENNGETIIGCEKVFINCRFYQP